MSEQNKNKQTANIAVFITSIFVIFMSITYAFVSQVLTGTKEVVVRAGVLDLVLEEENEITISDALPMYDEAGMIQEDVFVFRLVNKTSNSTNYVLKLQEIETGTLDKSTVKYGLIKEGEKTIDLVSNITDGIIDKGIIRGNEIIDYELRLWIDSSVTGIEQVQNKYLSFKVSAVTNQQIATIPFVETLEERVQESTDTFPNFRMHSSETNGRGIYKYQEDGVDIYYWRGKVSETANSDNNVIFAGMCWQMVRTTKTGGIKVIYNGTPVKIDGVNTCPNTGEASQLASKSVFNLSYKALAYVGYMYGNTVYEYKTKGETDTALTTAGILYGYDVEWNGTKYTLKTKEESGSLFSSTGSWETDRTSVANGNHYTCFDREASCETVNYVYYAHNSYPYYIELTGGATIEKALEQMYSNEQSSTIKMNIENWFESVELDKEENLSKLEDIVYCNDRSVQDGTLGGWSKDGDASQQYLHYSSVFRHENGTPDLSCREISENRDRFTYKDTVNGNGLLKWPVGLLTVDEITLAGGYNRNSTDYYLYTGQDYWTLSPRHLNTHAVYGFYVKDDGWPTAGFTNRSFGIRPVISLAPGTKFVYGTTGTASNPYVVE